MADQKKELISLNIMSVGQKGVIAAFSVDTAQGERVQEMGLSPGEQLEVVRVHGDTIEIKIRGYFVSLKEEEAGHIKVRPLD